MKSSPIQASPAAFRHYRHPGFWISALMATLMLINAVRCLIDPAAFSVYFGLPLTDPATLPWVGVYGLRALFIGLLTALFLIKRDPASLQWIALFALVMPIGDAWLVHSSGGATVWRHLTIFTVILVAFFCIRAWRNSVNRAGEELGITRA